MAARRRRVNDRPSRERILASATEEFAARGFAGARIDRIARKVGLNVRMIYYHFAGKEALYRAVLEEILAETLRAVESGGSGADSSIEAFFRYFDLLVGNPRFADILVREFLDGARHLRALAREGHDRFRALQARAHELVVSSQRAGAFRATDPAMTVTAIAGAVTYLTIGRHAADLLAGDYPPEPGAWKAELIDLFLNGLRPRT